MLRICLFHLPRRFMQSLVWKQQWIAPLDAKCKIKTGRVWEHKTGKLIAPNNILIFTDFWHYVRAVLNQHLVSSSSHLQANGNGASGTGIKNKCHSMFLSVQICGGLKHDFTYCSYASNIIATLKVEGWQKCACILNLDNCAAACIYGAEQSITVPLLQVAEDTWMDACIQAEVASTGVWEAEVMHLLPGYIQPWADLLYVLLNCNMLFSSFEDWLSGKGNRFYL